MLSLLRVNKWFYLPYLVFIVIGGFLLLSFTKIQIHWFINQQNSSIADWFFKYYTHFGDGIILVIVIPIMLFLKYRHAITLTISSILVIILVQLFKRYIIPDVDRPLLVFESVRKLHLVDGITVHIAHSFPSGHSATAFSIYLMFAIVINNKYIKLLFFMIAFLVAYSRIYLSQHFLVDAYFGSIIGVVSTTLIYLCCKSIKNNKLDLSLKNLFKKKRNVEIT